MTAGTGPSLPRLLDQGLAIELILEGRPCRFHAMWLRDNAADPGTRSAGNGQRLITLLDIPAETRVADATWDGATLVIRFAPDGKIVTFDAPWLIAHAYDLLEPPKRPGWTGAAITRWDASLAPLVPVAHYDAILADPAMLHDWLETLRRYGFARLTGAPATEGMAEKIVSLFGFVRETNYGRVFDVRSEVEPSNLAFTNLGLQSHTDNPYRDPVPGLQVLACLENDVDGGETLLVDGFAIAERLQAEQPEGFSLLARHCARFEYAGTEGVLLRAKRPIIELGCDGELIGIRFNNRSAAPFVDIGYDDMAAYYAAYRRLAELIDDPCWSFRFRLSPGNILVIDNQRVLHGRTAYSGEGRRRLQGCYADKDGLTSTLDAFTAVDRRT
jgi:gamma-butyrobetaine dioxygenase